MIVLEFTAQTAPTSFDVGETRHRTPATVLKSRRWFGAINDSVREAPFVGPTVIGYYTVFCYRGPSLISVNTYRYFPDGEPSRNLLPKNLPLVRILYNAPKVTF